MTDRILRVTRGQPISAARANRVGDQLAQLADQLAPEFGTAFDPDAHSQLMTITDVSGAFLLAIAGTLAPVGGETIFTVRLAPELVEAARAGVAVTVTDVNTATATDGVVTEDWKMTKSFAIGDVIEAFQWDSDGVFVDRNIAGRMWAADGLVQSPPFTP